MHKYNTNSFRKIIYTSVVLTSTDASETKLQRKGDGKDGCGNMNKSELNHEFVQS